MKISEIVVETASAGATGSGSIAAVNVPLGKVIKRPNPSIYSYGIKTKKSKKKKSENRGFVDPK